MTALRLPSLDETIGAYFVATRSRLHARLGGLKTTEIRANDGLR